MLPTYRTEQVSLLLVWQTHVSVTPWEDGEKLGALPDTPTLHRGSAAVRTQTLRAREDPSGKTPAVLAREPHEGGTQASTRAGIARSKPPVFR